MTIIAPDTGAPAAILRLGNAFCDAKAVLTGVELDLFTALRDSGPATAAQIRDRLGLHGRGLSDLLDLLATLGLLHRTPDYRYGNSSGARAHLVRGAAGYLGEELGHANRELYPLWAGLPEALRTGSGPVLHDLRTALAKARGPVPGGDSAPGILWLGNAFRDCQALLTAAELGLFTVLRDRPSTVDEIAAGLGLAGPGLADLCGLLVALQLLLADGDRYRNTPDADRYLVDGRAASVTGFLRGLRANLYPLWGGLTETLRTGRPLAGDQNFEAMLADRREQDRYVSMMDGLIQVVGPLLVDAVDWTDRSTVLDVGGCRGNLAGQIAKAHPQLTVRVFDLPQMRRVFDDYIGELGLADRVVFHGGDFFRDELPAADVIVFGHVLHNWTLERRRLLVDKAFRALNPGGALVVHDRMLDADRSNVDNLLASLMMALVTEDGSEYPISELVGLAEAAGFTAVRHRPLDENETLVECHKA